MKLSILIPTLHSRRKQFDKLFALLMSQTPILQDSEVLNWSNNGERNIGYYRQQLLNAAKGDYIAFIDDDDEVPGDYVARILKAISDFTDQWGTEPDCCSLTGELRWVGNNSTEPFEHSIKHQAWDKVDGVYVRYPNHLNAVRRDLALQVGFKDMGHGEDRDYSDRLKPLLKTEAPIDGVLYYYNCRG